MRSGFVSHWRRPEAAEGGSFAAPAAAFAALTEARGISEMDVDTRHRRACASGDDADGLSVGNILGRSRPMVRCSIGGKEAAVGAGLESSADHGTRHVAFERLADVKFCQFHALRWAPSQHGYVHSARSSLTHSSIGPGKQ